MALLSSIVRIAPVSLSCKSALISLKLLATSEALPVATAFIKSSCISTNRAPSINDFIFSVLADSSTKDLEASFESAECIGLSFEFNIKQLLNKSIGDIKL